MIDKEELQTLIPHRGKMLLLSRVIEYEIERSIRAEYDISGDCIFYDPAVGGVPAWAGFEFMAQAISVLSGIRGREKGEKPKAGFILSIPFMQISIPVFRLGSSVEVRVEAYDCIDLIYTFGGEAFLDGKKVMEGKLLVMEITEERFKSMIEEHG